MKACIFLRRITVVSGIVSLSLLWTFAVYASDGENNTGAHEKPINATEQAMMAKWQAYATPGEAHKVLDPLVGTWDHIVKWWMKPSSEPEISQGTSTNTWVMGGRYLQHMVQGVSMGQPFEGMGIIGFDNKDRKYQTIWMDNMGTGIMIGEGTYDPKKKTLVDKGHFTDAVMGQRAYSGVTTFTDDNHYRYEMYGLDQAGNKYRMMEVLYTRTD